MNTLLADLLTVPSLDAEDARRRRLLNIVLLGIAGLTALTLFFASILLVFQGTTETAETRLLFGALGATLVGSAIIYAINRFWSGGIAATLLLLMLIAVLSFSDTPAEVAGGRTLFLFTIPVIMASVLLRPWSSFIAAGVVGVVVAFIGINAGLQYNPAITAGFVAIALVSWLAARSLEQALVELREINIGLDNLVSERTRELYEALRKVSAESSKNQAILESIADGVIVFDDHGEVFAINPSMSSLINRPATEILGRTLDDLIKTGISNEGQDTVRDLVAVQQERTESAKVAWGDRVLSISYAPVKEADGEVTGGVMVFRDFTSEAELDRMKSAFVSMASHELRTPLNAILGYSDMLTMGVVGNLTEKQTEILHRVMANGRRMLGLVNNLLDQAQMEAGRLEISAYPIRIDNLISDVIATLRVLAEQKTLGLDYSVAHDVPGELISDPQRITQIVMNLVGNAIKFTEEGKVSIRVFRPDETHWSIAVQDTGVGIAKEAQQYVFETFRQATNDPTTRREQGSGLGLSIVKQLAVLMDGDVTLTSEPGEGSTFTVTLPLKPVAQKEAATA